MPTMDERSDKKFANMNAKDKVALLADLPSLPALLMETLHCTTGNQNLSNLADKISQDPPMAVRILRVANSPFYGMSREIGSLQEAVVVLGINRIRNLLLGVGFMNTLSVHHQNFDYSLFWHHSMTVADCTRQLALHAGIDQDIAFTAGLLHDIGLLAIVLLFPDDFSRITAEPHLNRFEAERQILGFNHANIGCHVAEHWNIPVAIQQAIEWHETQPAQGAWKSLGALIYTANLMVRAEQSDDPALAHQSAISLALEMLNVPIDQATEWVNNSRQFADQILAIF